ncbi:MAG: hypothetical protein ABEI31_03605 [Halodesulfurarchaeum sp.]
MADGEPVRAWLVDRTYTDKGLISLVYATEDGTRYQHKQQSLHAPDPTAAIETPPDELERVEDEADRAKYREAASRMAENHDPDDRV